MYTVYCKNDMTIFQSGFESWIEAKAWANSVYGPKNYDIVME